MKIQVYLQTYHADCPWSTWKDDNWKMLLFSAWYLKVIQTRREGIREGDKFLLPHSFFISFLFKAEQGYKGKIYEWKRV